MWANYTLNRMTRANEVENKREPYELLYGTPPLLVCFCRCFKPG